MAYQITDDCINCGACLDECPVEAIFEPEDDTYIEDQSYSEDYFYIVPSICVNCEGHFDEPQCLSVCPVDAIFQITPKQNNTCTHTIISSNQ